jgi:hypothetical protein
MNKLSPDQQMIVNLFMKLSADMQKEPTGAMSVPKETAEALTQLGANALIDLNRCANALETIAMAVGPLAAMSAQFKGGKIIKP